MMDSVKWSPDTHIYIPLISEFEDRLIDKMPDILTNMQQTWHYSIHMVIIYLILIPTLKMFIEIRGKPFELRYPLILWNIGLATFSILGVIRCLPQFIHIFTTKGFSASYCEADYFWDLRVHVWYWLFYMSKVVELFDTMFILLRGGKLNFLHWIHHALTLFICWFESGYMRSNFQWTVNMNLFVHSFMYSHYALTALRYTIHKSLRIGITTLQIIQMAIGICINIEALDRKLHSEPCDASINIILLGLILYIIYLILFINFFIKTYLKRKKVN